LAANIFQPNSHLSTYKLGGRTYAGIIRTRKKVDEVLESLAYIYSIVNKRYQTHIDSEESVR
jgi:hypothetical protein